MSSFLDPKRDFRRLVDLNTTKAVECFSQLIKNAKMNDSREEAYVEGSRVSALTMQMVHANEQLLMQIEQLRRIITLQDYDTINAELDQETEQLKACRDELLREIREHQGKLKTKTNRDLAA